MEGQGRSGPVLCLLGLPLRQTHEGGMGSAVGACGAAGAERRGAAGVGHLHFRTLHRGFCCAAPPLETRRYCRGRQERVSLPVHTLCFVTTGLFLSMDSKHHEGCSHGNLLTVVSLYLQYSQACRRCFVQTVFVD